MCELAASILAADFLDLRNEIHRIDDAGTDRIHLDVMDGRFVPNISFGTDLIRAMRKETQKRLDVHLMVEEPERHLQTVAACGVNEITIHAETTNQLHRVLSQVKQLGIQAGVALNPATPFSGLEYVLEELDQILIMTVNPGFGGQCLIPSILQKIRLVRQLIDRSGKKIKIAVDGGVTKQNIAQLAEAGADVLIAGTAVFAGVPKQNIQELKMEMERGRRA